MSQLYGNFDGFTLCGLRDYTKVSPLTSVDNAAPDETLITLNSATRTFIISGTTPVQYGEYVVTYKAAL